MKKSNKRGFTIVELVIVIAVIAILAAVLIPTFSGVINKANQAKDTQLVRNLNTSLKLDVGVKHNTMQDALDAVAQQGYDLDRINASAMQAEILWDSHNDAFVYLDGKGNINYLPEIEKDREATPLELWQICKEMPATQEYSIYAGNGWNVESVNDLKVGFDAGKNTNIKSVIYVNSGSEQSVVIRTNSFETLLVVYAPNDTVDHYGYAYLADIQSIDSECFNAHGTYGRLKITSGTANIKDDATVFCAMDIDGEATQAVINVQGKVYTEKMLGEDNVNAGVTQQNTGVFNSLYADCGYGHHNMQKLVVDESHVYEVCTACGYTVKIAGANNGVPVYHTSDDHTESASDPTVTVAGGVVTVDTTNATPVNVMGEAKETGIADNADLNAWLHDSKSIYGKLIGSFTADCFDVPKGMTKVLDLDDETLTLNHTADNSSQYNYDFGAYYNSIAGNLTIKASSTGKIVVNDFGIMPLEGGNLTIESGKFELGNNESCAQIFYLYGGSLIINNGLFDSGYSVINVYCSNGLRKVSSITINNGIFSGGNGGNLLLNIFAGSTITINGGLFTSNNEYGLLALGNWSWSEADDSGYAVITGGIFDNGENVVFGLYVDVEHFDITITGGTFDSLHDIIDYIEEGYHGVISGDKFTVVED